VPVSKNWSPLDTKSKRNEKIDGKELKMWMREIKRKTKKPFQK
jgi:hypothetical protein